MALTVGAIDRGTLVQKGQLPFVEAARQLPDVRFVLAGKWLDDAVGPATSTSRRQRRVHRLAVRRGPARRWYRRAAVYVQASRHEGFGLAVAEACWPAACRW